MHATKVRGRALIGVEECFSSERRSLGLYVANSEEDILKYIITSNNLVEGIIEREEEYRRRIDGQNKNLREAIQLHGQWY